MKNFKRLVISVSLTLVLAGAAFADDPTPPCSTNPGELNSPPCSSSQLVADDSGNQSGSTISNEVDTLTIETAISAIESLLTIY